MVCKKYPSKKKILYCPFSYRDIAVELENFINIHYNACNQIMSQPFITQIQYSELFAYLDPFVKSLILQNPYQELGFQKIFTIVRSDGIVIMDKVTSDINAKMVQIEQSNQVLTNVKVKRYDSAEPIVLPTEITNARIQPNLKIYSDQRIDVFEPFTTRQEFIQVASNKYFGISSRPAIFVIGQLYCVAQKVVWSNGIEAFVRLSYLRVPKAPPK